MEELRVETSLSVVAEDRKHLLSSGSYNLARVQEGWLIFAYAMASAIYPPKLEASSPLKGKLAAGSSPYGSLLKAVRVSSQHGGWVSGMTVYTREAET